LPGYFETIAMESKQNQYNQLIKAIQGTGIAPEISRNCQIAPAVQCLVALKRINKYKLGFSWFRL